MLLDIWLVLGSPARSRELDWMILLGPFQLEIVNNSMILCKLLGKSKNKYYYWDFFFSVEKSVKIQHLVCKSCFLAQAWKLQIFQIVFLGNLKSTENFILDFNIYMIVF